MGSVFCVFAALMWLDQEITPLNGPTLYPSALYSLQYPWSC